MGNNVECLRCAKLQVGHFICILILISHNPRKFLFLVRQLRPRAVKQLTFHISSTSDSI